MTLRNGATFAGYTILRLLGSGGMGEVYLVQHPRLPRQRALKILPVHVSADTEFRDRFYRKPTWPPPSIIRTLSAYTIEASSMANCGSRWTTWRAPTLRRR